MTTKKPKVAVPRQAAQFMRRELPQWERDGWVSPETAALMSEKYALSETAKPLDAGRLAMMGIMGFGALLVGGGIITIVSANWEALSIASRCALLFVVMFAWQVGVWWASANRSERGVWLHVFALVEALSFGACIGLVAQIFNIVSYTGDAYLIWTLSSIAIALAARSVPVAILAAVTSTVWVFHQSEMRGTPYANWMLLMPIMQMAVFCVMGWFMRSGWLCAVAVFSSLIISLYSGVMVPEQLGLLVVILWPLILCNGTQLLSVHLGRRGVDWLLERRLPATAARVWLMVVLLVFSFDFGHYSSPKTGAAAWILLAVVAVICAGQVFAQTRLLPILNKRDHILSQAIIHAAIFAAVMWVGNLAYPFLLFSLALVCIGGADIWTGFSEGRRGVFWRGLLLLMMLAFMRFIEIKTLLVVKGICFIGAGVLTGYIGLMFERWLKKHTASIATQEDTTNE